MIYFWAKNEKTGFFLKIKDIMKPVGFHEVGSSPSQKKYAALQYIGFFFVVRSLARLVSSQRREITRSTFCIFLFLFSSDGKRKCWQFFTTIQSAVSSQKIFSFLHAKFQLKYFRLKDKPTELPWVASRRKRFGAGPC